MAMSKFVLLSFNKRKDGKIAIVLRVTKNRKRKYLKTGLYATSKQWDEQLGRFLPKKKLTPNFRDCNLYLSELEIKAENIIKELEREGKNWTLNQFEDIFLNKDTESNVLNYFQELVETLRETGHHGNANCYQRTLRMLTLFDSKFHKRVFLEIDYKYVNQFNIFLEKRGCKKNTRKYYLKALRALFNKAIKDREATEENYPFGRNGFNISDLEEETAKRYLPQEYMLKLKNTTINNSSLEVTRKIFLFSYYCYGISFVDAAHLKRKNIFRYDNDTYIVYKRNKTQSAKNSKPIQIRVTEEIKNLLEWFEKNTLLVDDYILPIISVAGYTGEKLYNHIRNRSKRNNQNLKRLADYLDIKDFNLTSYVSRHTMAMTLQDNKVPREVISQILGHKDLATTNVYLDSFKNSVIDEAVKVL